MPVVRLRAPLSELASGRAELRFEGLTLVDVLRALEREHPALAGWILDELGRIRPHINVFVNQQLGVADTRLAPDDRVHVLPAITGGQE
jgi:sulfur-carrier protein